MTSMPRPKMTPEPIGPDVDLEVEDVRTADGRRLTPELAEEIAEHAVKHARAGRPSVTGDNIRTPSLTVRVPARTRAALEAIAKTRGRRLADVSRDAFDEYIERHAS